MKFILFKKKKKKIQNLPHAVCVQCAWTKQKKSQIFLNSWRERQRVRERERKPKSWKPETVKPQLRSAKATTGHRQTVPHCTAHACWLLLPLPPPLGHATRRSPIRFCSQIWYVFVLFCFVFFFLFLSFFSGSATSLLLTALPSCLLFCYLVFY